MLLHPGNIPTSEYPAQQPYLSVGDPAMSVNMSRTSSAFSASDIQGPLPSYAGTDAGSTFDTFGNPFFGSSQAPSIQQTEYLTSPTTPFTPLGSNAYSASPQIQHQESLVQTQYNEIQQLRARVKELESQLEAARKIDRHRNLSKRHASQELSDSNEDILSSVGPPSRKLGKRRAYDNEHDVGASQQPSVALYEEATDQADDLINWKTPDADANLGYDYGASHGGNI
jgi:hypothetical protein